jgi:excisionase family DNA binding protein
MAIAQRTHLLSAEQAARRLGVSAETVRRWIATGQLEGVRLGDARLARYRTSPDAIERFLQRPAGERGGAE